MTQIGQALDGRHYVDRRSRCTEPRLLRFFDFVSEARRIGEMGDAASVFVDSPVDTEPHSLAMRAYEITGGSPAGSSRSDSSHPGQDPWSAPWRGSVTDFAASVYQ